MHNDGRFDFHNALRYSSDELANILSHCFENYIVRFVVDGPTFAARFGAEDLSLNDSLIVTHRHEPVAVALIARRGRHSRVAGVYVRPAVRGPGRGQTRVHRRVGGPPPPGGRPRGRGVI
ncbi:GNAT family N-acetyltransferase, partial [Serratia sp. IR-2025]